jgi:hypothetical protein
VGISSGTRDLTLTSDRLIVHGAEGPVDLPLPYEIHARLIQTPDFARLLAEHVRAELPAQEEKLPVRLFVPMDWGPVLVRLPYDSLDGLEQPAHHLFWEVETNAPEGAEQYLYDLKALGDGQGELCAFREGLCRFCEVFCEELGFQLVEMVPVMGDETRTGLNLAAGREWKRRLEGERFPRVFSWKPLAAASLLLAAVLLVAFVSRQPADEPVKADIPAERPSPVSPVMTEKQEPAVSTEMLTENSVQPRDTNLVVTREHESAQAPEQEAAAPRQAPAAVPVNTRRALAGGWKELLVSLSGVEERLPDFMVLDSGGMLVRREGPGGLALAEQTGRASRVSRVGDQAWWLHFDQPLLPSPPGRRVLGQESMAEKPRSLFVDNLLMLADTLDAAPFKLILQRRGPVDAAGSVYQWSLGEVPGGSANGGWRVKIYPLAGGR